MIFGSLYLPDESKISISEEIKIRIDKKNKSISLETVNADMINVRRKEIEDITFLEYCYFEQSKTLIFCDLYGFTLYRVSFEDGIIWASDMLNRKESDDRGFCQIRFFEIPNGCIFVYEAGVLRLDNLGNVIWHNKHQRYDWIFAGINYDSVLYESEENGRWTYSLIDGR